MKKQKKLTSHVTTLTDEQGKLLKKRLDEQFWTFSEIPHANWKAKREKTNIVFYKSGKLTIQGGGTEEFILFCLEPEILKKATLGYEEEPSFDDLMPLKPYIAHAGIDESGKGDFFGPLVIATAFVDEKASMILEQSGVKDSKLIKSDKKIQAAARAIRSALKGRYAIVTINPESYNRLYSKIGNLNKLLAWGHARSLENLLEKVPECKNVLADKFGNERLIKAALLKNGKSIQLEQKVRAESDIAVAAASILARDEFVRRIDKMGVLYKMTIPKGASAKVIAVGKELVKQHGVDILDKTSKTHFKTTLKVKGLL